MSLTWIDWSIVAVLAVVIFSLAAYTRQFNRSVADYLAGNRTAGRYLLTIASGIAGFGAITAVANFEMYYKAGFPAVWWTLMTSPTALIIALSGWIIYRYRQTRALTLCQFFEIRYNRSFRIFAGLLCFLSGIINYGIFPAVTARFFIHFAHLPAGFDLLGIHFSTYVLLMLAELSIALYFVTLGGHVTVMVTDFVQGLFCNVVFMALLVFIFWRFGWSDITAGLARAPEHESMINPFKTSGVPDFNFWFFAIGFFGSFYQFMSWQGSSAFNTSARSPHEARMAGVLAGWRSNAQWLMLLILPIVAYAVLHLPKFADLASVINADIAHVPDPGGNGEGPMQMTVPLVLSHLLPVGIAGMFMAMMMSAAVSTDNASLHSWGSIFIQDVILPFRKTPLTPKQHVLFLRLSTAGVAIFAFCFSLLYGQSMYILFFMYITGAIFVAGSGAAIIGGLYWKRGTAGGAWASMICGCVISVAGILLDRPDVWHRLPGFQHLMARSMQWMHDAVPGLGSWDVQAAIADLPNRFPINANYMSFIAEFVAVGVYVGISLVQNRVFDMDRMLHRGQYAVATGGAAPAPAPVSGWRALFSFGPEFTRGDKLLYIATILWTVGWFAIFVLGTIYSLSSSIDDSIWSAFWRIKIWIGFGLGVVCTVWFLAGGLRDMGVMFRELRTMRRDHTDMGMVLHEDAGQPAPQPVIAISRVDGTKDTSTNGRAVAGSSAVR